MFQEVQKVFVTVMQGVSYVNTYMMLQKRLNKEFVLLGYKLPMALKDLLSAANIIGTGKGNVIL